MAAKTSIAIEEYLHTSYADGDREYVDGEIWADHRHGRAQTRLAVLPHPAVERHELYPCIQSRMGVAPNRIRIPDLALFKRQPETLAPKTPPILTIEILSPSDVWSTVLQKCSEYEAWGVEHVWLIDLEARELRVYEAGDLRRVEALSLDEHEILLTADQLFPKG